MTKVSELHQWLLRKNDWVYLNEVPFVELKMSRPQASSTLIALCKYGCADFRIQGTKQYRATDKPTPTLGRPKKEKNND